MPRSIVYFLVAACKEKRKLQCFSISSLEVQNKLPSIVLTVIAPLFLDSMLGSLGSEKFIDNVGEVSSHELIHKNSDVSVDNLDKPINKGKEIKKINKKQIVFFRTR